MPIIRRSTVLVAAVAVGVLAPAVAVVPAAAAPEAPESRGTRVAGWSSAPATLTIGQRFVEQLRIAPHEKRRRFEVRWRQSGRDWVVRQQGRSKPDGGVTVRYRPPAVGRYAVKVSVARTSKAKGTSVRRKVVVQPKPTPPPPPPPPPTPTPTPTPTLPPIQATPLPRLTPEIPVNEPFTAYAVGDIGWCDEDNPDNANQAATARLIPDEAMLLALGDLAQNDGDPANFRDCYLPYYGRLMDTTYPVPGNHEYRDLGLYYFSLFGPRVGTPELPWYGFRHGGWSFYQMNSNCRFLDDCLPESLQVRWLAAQLAIDDNRCVAVTWHHPRWAATPHGPYDRVSDLYQVLANAGVDLLLTGHEHSYQRFPRLAPDGSASATGPRQFIVGTGGARLGDYRADVLPQPEVKRTTKHGVLQMEFRPDGYDWRFLATDDAYVDRGSDVCT